MVIFLIVISRIKLLPLRRNVSKILSVVMLVAGALLTQRAGAQVTIKGTVYNINRSRPLEAVSVLSTSGRGTLTDSNGNYTIFVTEKDSISFSYLGRTTAKFPIHDILAYPTFDVALHVDPVDLKPVRVMPRNYHMDSLQNRKDYAKVFDYKKPGFKLTDGSQGLGAGIDLRNHQHVPV